MKKLLYTLLFISFLSYSQGNDWKAITKYDVGYMYLYFIVCIFLCTSVYVYNGELKIVSAVISEDGTHYDAELKSADDLKKYYKGIIDGYASDQFEIRSTESYNIKDLFLEKSTLQVNYDDGTVNFIELHVLFLNDKNYLFTFQYADDAEEEILKDKNYFPS